MRYPIALAIIIAVSVGIVAAGWINAPNRVAAGYLAFWKDSPAEELWQPVSQAGGTIVARVAIVVPRDAPAAWWQILLATWLTPQESAAVAELQRGQRR